MAEKNVKKRHWAMVVYPESLPNDWIDRLERTGLPMAISPIHDRDDNATGEHKKDHYHVLMTYQGPTAYSVVKRLTDDLGQPHPQPVEQIRGYYRYLTHEDNPEKAQYDKADIRKLNGFDIRDYVEMGKSEALRIRGEITDYIEANGITEYADIITIARADNAPADWFDVLSSNTLYFTALLRSWRFKRTGRE